MTDLSTSTLFDKWSYKIPHRLVSAYENKVLVKTDYIYAWFTANYGEPSFSKFVSAVLHSATRYRIRDTAELRMYCALRFGHCHASLTCLTN